MPGHKLSSPRRRTKCPAEAVRENETEREAACQLERVRNRSQTKQSKPAAEETEESQGGELGQPGEAAVNNRISVSDGHRRWTRRRGAPKAKVRRSFDNCQMQWTIRRGRSERVKWDQAQTAAWLIYGLGSLNQIQLQAQPHLQSSRSKSKFTLFFWFLALNDSNVMAQLHWDKQRQHLCEILRHSAGYTPSIAVYCS